MALCFPGQENYTRLYACTDANGQALLYRSRSRAAPFLVEANRDMTALGISCYAVSRRYAAVPLCPQLLGYLNSEGHGAAGLEKALDAQLTGSGAQDTLLCPVTAQGTLRAGETVEHLQADSGAVGIRLTLCRSVQRAAEAVAAQSMTTGCILVLDVRTAALRACVSVPGFDPEDPGASLDAADSPFLNRACAPCLAWSALPSVPCSRSWCAGVGRGAPAGYAAAAQPRPVSPVTTEKIKKTHPTFTKRNLSDCASLQIFRKMQKGPFLGLICAILDRKKGAL